MYYIVQENTWVEDQYEYLITSLDRLGLEYEIVKVIPFVEEIEFQTKRKDIFCFGGMKLSRLSKLYNWKPGSLMNSNHDYMVYKDYYKENLLNYDSKIFKITDEFKWNGDFFCRPTLDTKIFTGKPFTMDEWIKERNRLLKNLENDKKEGLITTVLNEDSEIQVCSLKNIQKEFRFWIVGGEIITASLYRNGCFVNYSDIIDDEATEFCEEMIKIFQLADAFVMDICLTDGEWKIIECGCISVSGFYKANIPKLLMALEDYFNN